MYPEYEKFVVRFNVSWETEETNEIRKSLAYISNSIYESYYDNDPHVQEIIHSKSGKMAFRVHQLQRSQVNYTICEFICAGMLRIIKVILINN